MTIIVQQTTANNHKPPQITANHHKFMPEFGTIGSENRKAGKPPQTTARIIGVNRPAFGGTVPHFHQMSRVPRNETDVPHFFKMVVIICLRCRLFYIFALERNKVTNKARFILRTPTDAVYISRVAAITGACLFCYAVGCINTATVTCHG